MKNQKIRRLAKIQIEAVYEIDESRDPAPDRWVHVSGNGSKITAGYILEPGECEASIKDRHLITMLYEVIQDVREVAAGVRESIETRSAGQKKRIVTMRENRIKRIASKAAYTNRSKTEYTNNTAEVHKRLFD